MSKKKLSEELAWRGMVKDRTFDDLAWIDTPRTFYLGSDCSSDSLTIGNLAIYMMAKHLVNYGWKPVLLIGGATSRVGDPGGKNEERPLKTYEEIEHNVAGVKAQVERLFAGHEFETVDNYDWFKDMGYLEFLREVGKHFSMTELLQRDFIQDRIGGNGISYAEFSYSMIQGYDYYWLFKNKGVELQIGGSDQWGNMMSGVPFIRKKEGKEAHAMSMPLVIDKATGRKFGKSEGGAVWLDAAKTSPTQFYQFWVNVNDESVEDHFKIYTMLSQEEVSTILEAHQKNPKEREAQRRLAREVTTIMHGEAETKLAEMITDFLTNKRPIAEAGDVLDSMKKEIPSTTAAPGAAVTDVLVQAGLAASKTEARRFVQENAVSINGAKTQKEQLEEGDFTNGRLLIRRGKAFKDSALVERS